MTGAALKKKTTAKKKEKNGLKLVIFDFDGTLVDSVPSIQKTANQIAESFGFNKISRKKVEVSVGAGLNKFIEWVFGAEMKKRKIKLVKIRDMYVRLYKKNHNYKMKTFSGVKPGLRYLKKERVKMAVISNKLGRFIKSSGKSTGIIKYFWKIIGRGELTKDKPHPYPIKYIMKKAGVNKKQTLFVGDSHYDVECAKRAGVKCLYLTYGYGDRKKALSMKPEYRAKSLKTIREIKEKW